MCKVANLNIQLLVSWLTVTLWVSLLPESSGCVLKTSFDYSIWYLPSQLESHVQKILDEGKLERNKTILRYGIPI